MMSYCEDVKVMSQWGRYMEDYSFDNLVLDVKNCSYSNENTKPKVL